MEIRRQEEIRAHQINVAYDVYKKFGSGFMHGEDELYDRAEAYVQSLGADYIDNIGLYRFDSCVAGLETDCEIKSWTAKY